MFDTVSNNAVANGVGRPVGDLGTSKRLFDPMGAPIKGRLEGLDEVERWLRQAEARILRQVQTAVEAGLPDLQRSMESAGWPGAQARMQRSGDRTEIILTAERAPWDLEFGTLNQPERPALRTWLHGALKKVAPEEEA